MKLIRDLGQVPETLKSGAVTIGNFDGVHRGHARIIERLRQFAAQQSGPAVVFTFDPHPVQLLRPEQTPPPLTWTDRKAELLQQLGVDAVIAYPTNEAFLQLTAREFFQQILVEKLDVRAMVEGPNFYFGRQREGNVELLAQLCQKQEILLDVVEPLQVQGQYISSSRIRMLILQGQVAEAGAMLTQPYRIRGLVVQGAQRGRTIGFPTANLAGVDTLLPAAGVYAGRALVDGQAWPAAMNLGPNPTFGENALKVEIHLIGYQGDLYGKTLEVDFIDRVREVRQFSGIEELIAQLRQDVELVKQLAG